ncbi:MFS general substrate transporter [Hyphodiscus hymeniophilus]|uniref:MFS general substrate transporter n=1 Tax=Hyphodiscus hymeniophilus TaxID=353542 RepID=A0A9P6SK53_9HELO|nr:MFS general substrate transporter [Hyphodiscus hymeniophilus]
MGSKSNEVEMGHIEGEESGTGSTATAVQQSIHTSDSDAVQEKGHAVLNDSHLEYGNPGNLSTKHREYLMGRHGTTDLDPLPSMDPADPLNWPSWKKNVNLFLVAFNAMITTLTAACVIPAFEQFSIELGISLTQASPPLGPFIMGFVVYHTGTWTWIYWILTITNGVQFVLYFFFSPETLYVRNQEQPPTSKSPFQREYLNFGKKGPSPLTARDFFTPIKLFTYPNILIPAIAYSIIFNFASVLLTVEIPQLFTPKFGFNPQQIGLQFIGMIVGSVIGELLGGRGSDFWMRRQGARSGRNRPAAPESRIWVAYPGFATVIIGLVVFCVQLDKIKSYNVSPIVGVAISAFGNQIITTVLVTYAVDCHHEHAASIGVFINFMRSTWGFIGPFWFPDMFASIGLDGSAGLMVGMIVACSIIPIVFIQWKGKSIREKRASDEFDQVETATR